MAHHDVRRREDFMFSITKTTLSPKARQHLTKFATYHGSLLKLRLTLMMKATSVFAGLLLVIACITLSGFLLFDALPHLRARLPSLVWALVIMYGFSLMVSVWDSRHSHNALCERKKFAQAALRDGRECEVVVEFNETSFALPHEHGMLYFVDDGQGGSVLLDVSTIADDPREPQARESRISTRWRMECVAGEVHNARFSGKKIPIRRIEGLDEWDEFTPEGLSESLGFSGLQDLARSHLPIHETEWRVRELLGPAPRP
jgi:hypothetical protein